ncbi:MAG: glutamate formimidoyltransferase [Nitrospirae bacterium]|nr:MAG: glutamate formimidoyltransferase [Nitrospirota bacterium]
MTRLVECVPNFSEGRKPGTIDALVTAIRAVPGVVLLDRQSDADHNRSVLTFIGPPEAAAEAAFRAAEQALHRIDLTTHRGEHPRVGATDVIPFVPIRGVTMEDCAHLARTVGRRLAEELHIPVFLYERAAKVPSRTHIEDIRRGGLEELGERMRTSPEWAPDFGDAKLHRTAGATIVGARPVLIAYNVNLATIDLDLAKAIAHKVRASNGGLPSVKAVGIDLKSRGCVQVSMNLTNYEETPVHAAFAAVKAEAARHGVAVSGSEVIGLIPEAAVSQVAAHHLMLENFSMSQVLEARMAQALTQDVSATVGPFLEAVSAPQAAPGGGSVAALAGAAAMALGVMVSGRLLEKETLPDKTADLRAKRDVLIQLRDRLQTAIREDAEAYGAVLRNSRRPAIDPERSAALTDALSVAIAVPLAITEWAVAGMQVLRALIPLAPPPMAADLKAGVFAAQAAGEGALVCVKANLDALKDDPRVPELLKRLGPFEKRLRERI